MAPKQEEQWARLVHMGYRPVIQDYHTDGSVRVVIARKLAAGVLPLRITPDGTLTSEGTRNRQLQHMRTR